MVYLILGSYYYSPLNKIEHTYHEAQIVTVDCGPPPVFHNGTVSYQNTTAGSEVHYQCYDGFTLEGEMTAVCRVDGRWSSTPVCRQLTGILHLSQIQQTIDLGNGYNQWHRNRSGCSGQTVTLFWPHINIHDQLS